MLGALAEAVKAQSSNDKQWNRLKEIFAAPSLQLVSFTITEKGYALQKADGTWFPFVEADIKNGPAKATGAMAVLTAMLYERYQAGKYPLALVSMDNCSQNGEMCIRDRLQSQQLLHRLLPEFHLLLRFQGCSVQQNR